MHIHSSCYWIDQFDGKKLCAWYDSNGLRLSYFPSAVENPMKTLTWTEIASRTDRLIRTGAYLSSEEVDAIRQHELKRIGEEIYFVFRDTIADMHKDIFNDRSFPNPFCSMSTCVEGIIPSIKLV